ncbi:hypothetical protein [Clostridium thermosuccinogenes]|uniref:hypothetical protein n=1 Tax=Clostridium thermosuccinogenes TaxID=84032 RepID=UPI0013749A81|nr:hypothetical protein [Pseudoclostridium thermosuccinogenes]
MSRKICLQKLALVQDFSINNFVVTLGASSVNIACKYNISFDETAYTAFILDNSK